MTNAETLSIVATIASAPFSVLAAYGLVMKSDNRPTQMWGYFFWSVAPFAVVAYMWASHEAIDLSSRYFILGGVGAVAGAVLGAILFVWLGYLFQGQTKVPTQTPAASEARNSIGNVSNNSGVITQGQKGDNR
jgi:multidrug transporter EmrE-like cation transporter